MLRHTSSARTPRSGVEKMVSKKWMDSSFVAPARVAALIACCTIGSRLDVGNRCCKRERAVAWYITIIFDYHFTFYGLAYKNVCWFCLIFHALLYTHTCIITGKIKINCLKIIKLINFSSTTSFPVKTQFGRCWSKFDSVVKQTSMKKYTHF